MKIAWFHSHLLHANSGGTRFVLDYSAELRSRFGHEVTLFCDVAGQDAAAQLQSSGVGLRELDTMSTNDPRYWITLPLRLSRKRKRLATELRGYDCVVNSMFPMNILVHGMDLPRVQMCYEPFAFFYDHGFLANFSSPQRLFFRAMKGLFSASDIRATRRMDSVLTVNNTNIPKIERVYGITPAVVYAGIDTTMYRRADSTTISSIRARHPGSPLLFHSTDLTGIKGTLPLLEVIRELRGEFPTMKLLLTVYVRNPQGTQNLLDRVRALGIENNVEYLGCLDKRELPDYYSAVDFVCQPSVNQPANWPLKEALLCGTPIIGGQESEETIDGVNGAKVTITDIPGSVHKLRSIFQRRSDLRVDTTDLIKHYSKDNCVARFNALVTKTYEDHRHHA